MDQHSSASVYIMDLTCIFGYFISRKTLEYICNELEKKKQAFVPLLIFSMLAACKFALNQYKKGNDFLKLYVLELYNELSVEKSKN